MSIRSLMPLGDIRTHSINEEDILVSYDVTALFTNVLLDETTNILVNKAFTYDWFNKTYGLYLQKDQYYKGNKGRCKESTIRGHRKNLSPRWDSVGFVGSNPIWGSDFCCVLLMVDSLHLPLFSL